MNTPQLDRTLAQLKSLVKLVENETKQMDLRELRQILLYAQDKIDIPNGPMGDRLIQHRHQLTMIIIPLILALSEINRLCDARDIHSPALITTSEQVILELKREFPELFQ